MSHKVAKRSRKKIASEVADWLREVFLAGIPGEPIRSVVKRGELFVKFPGSALKPEFDSSETPWVREPIESSGDGVTRFCTFVGPIQSGKSAAGEVVLCDRFSNQSNGDIQYNWPNDKKADEKWKRRVRAILEACSTVVARFPDLNKWGMGALNAPHLNLTCQGVFTDTNVSSDSIRCQINEELHDAAGGWSPGRLDQAYGRLTAYWDSFAMNISNAGYKDDQLHQALKKGTHQLWSVKCPGCGLYHVMRDVWDDKHPELGGLRYDAAGCRRGPHEYDYNKLAGTVRYQMPCGYLVHDDKAERKKLSDAGRYTEPTNKNAPPTDRSYTLEAVSIHYIPWLSLITQKHEALRALHYGDALKYSVYTRERGCRFWDPNDRPLTQSIVINDALRKTRAGLKSHAGFAGRFFALDWQQGESGRGELEHWWLVIRDATIEEDPKHGRRLRTLLVFEGKVETDQNVLAILDDHECIRRFGCADSGDNTKHIYAFCYRNDIRAVKGSKSEWFAHPGGARRCFEPERLLCAMMNTQPKYPQIQHGNLIIPHADEPRFWMYSRVGILNLHNQVQNAPGIIWENPADVSEAYTKSMASWELQDDREKGTQRPIKKWVQIFDRDDLKFCDAYIAMQMEMAGLIGDISR